MNAKTRFLTGSLATLAVASAMTLAGPSAQAADTADRPCGLPATPAVYTSLFHEPVLVEVPAVTHDEWLWERIVTTVEHEFAKVVSAAYDETDWTREVPGTVEHLWSLKVIDRAAVAAIPGTPEQGHFETVVVTPAVTVTEFQYIQHKTGRSRWAPEGWNAGNDEDEGWYRTDNTRVEILTPEVSEQQWVVDQAAIEGTPAVTELSHTEEVWAASTPGADWTGPHDSRTVGGSTESTTTTGDDLPAGNAWNKLDTRHVPAVVDTVWAQTAPDGYIPTGDTRDLAIPEQTDVPSAAAPDGEGWSRIAGSLVVVVDQPTTTDLIPGYTEQVEILPAMPATEPCVEGPEAPDTDEPSNSAVAGPQADDAGEGAGTSTVASAAGASTASVLPATGNAVSPLITAGGFAALLAGSALVRVARRRQAD